MSAQIKDGGPVDVLVRAVERLRVPHPDHAQDAANNAAAIALHEYSAAVAELIDKVDSALALGWSDTAARELRAARARIGGAK